MESYIGVNQGANNTTLGIRTHDLLVYVNGYIGQGIAYSWGYSNSHHNVTVTFCTPKNYIQDGNTCASFSSEH